MTPGTNANDTNVRGSDIPESTRDKRLSLCVVLDSIRSDIETRDSFTIKFALLTKTPISKMKHLVGKLPATIWSGQGLNRAEHVLELIEEAGGVGRIVESGAATAVEAPTKENGGRTACSYCGFPLKEGATSCEFCLTLVGTPGKKASRPPARRTYRPVPPKRLFWYIVIIVAGIIYLVAAR